MRDGERRIRELYDAYRRDTAYMQTRAQRWHLWWAYRAAAYQVAGRDPRLLDLVRALFGSEP
jgi:hypothetical protein